MADINDPSILRVVGIGSGKGIDRKFFEMSGETQIVGTELALIFSRFLWWFNTIKKISRRRVLPNIKFIGFSNVAQAGWYLVPEQFPDRRQEFNHHHDFGEVVAIISRSHFVGNSGEVWSAYEPLWDVADYYAAKGYKMPFVGTFGTLELLSDKHNQLRLALSEILGQEVLYACLHDTPTLGKMFDNCFQHLAKRIDLEMRLDMLEDT